VCSSDLSLIRPSIPTRTTLSSDLFLKLGTRGAYREAESIIKNTRPARCSRDDSASITEQNLQQNRCWRRQFRCIQQSEPAIGETIFRIDSPPKLQRNCRGPISILVREHGVPSRQNARWHAHSVARVISRMENAAMLPAAKTH
jgi:hypothetical protein